ncbi:MAG: hypothetical protein JRJ47_09160 [Deltaproteobacteria bacterium]|nr:hypothetical protein [Deltaproteobacteria bacterium]
MATPFRGENIKKLRVQEGDHHFHDILSQDHLTKVRNNQFPNDDDLGCDDVGDNQASNKQRL